MSLEIEDFLDHIDQWKHKVYEELKDLTPEERKAYWARVHEEARARGLNVVDPKKPARRHRKRA